jgi:hypothetical protein
LALDGDAWLRWIPVIAGFASSVAGSAALYLAFRFHAERTLAEQIRTVPVGLIEEYLDRELPPGIRGSNGQVLRTLKQARELARPALNDGPERRAFLERSVEEGTWENAVAHEVSVALNRVGILVLAGGLPPRVVLALNGRQFVEDWDLCSKLVKELIREQREFSPRADLDVGWHRRHGEWLACAAAIYLADQWTGPYLGEFIRRMGGLDAVRERERAIRRMEPELGPRSASKAIRKLLGKT